MSLTILQLRDKINSLRSNLSEKVELFQTQISCTELESTSVEQLTTSQSKSVLWKKHRVSRITASKSYCVVKQADDNFQLKTQKPALITVADNVVADVLKYRRDFFSKATNWGIKNENRAARKFFSDNRSKHSNLKMTEAGLKISTSTPFLQTE